MGNVLRWRKRKSSSVCPGALGNPVPSSDARCKVTFRNGARCRLCQGGPPHRPKPISLTDTSNRLLAGAAPSGSLCFVGELPHVCVVTAPKLSSLNGHAPPANTACPASVPECSCVGTVRRARGTIVLIKTKWPKACRWEDGVSSLTLVECHAAG